MKKTILLLTLLCLTTALYCQDSQLFKKARDLEKKNMAEKAVQAYKLFLESSSKTALFDRIQLKIARLTPDFSSKVSEYNYFLERFSTSKYYFIALYELGMLHFMNNDLGKAESIFTKLAAMSKKTSYWQKAMIHRAQVRFKEGNYDSSLADLYVVLEEIFDYEDIGTIYYLIGTIMEKKKSYDEAIEYFLICAGSFSRSSKAPSALLQLTGIFLEQGEKGKSRYITGLLAEKYPESFDYKEAAKLTRGVGARKEKVELIDLNNNQEIQDKILSRLKKDLKDSDMLPDASSNSTDKTPSVTGAGYYIQLGFYSSRANARALIDKLETLSISGCMYREVIRKGKTYYKVLRGPYSSYENARIGLKKVKSKNIEAIIVELSNSYE